MTFNLFRLVCVTRFNNAALLLAGVHITATALGGERQVELYTDMPHPLVASPASVAVTYLRTEGGAGQQQQQKVYSLCLLPTQAVLLQPAGAAVAASVKVAAVAWPKLDGMQVQHFWGKHHRVAFPPRMPPPAPRPYPHPSPPPSPPVACKQVAAVPGFTCYDSHCAFDGPSVPAQSQCGHGICNPANGQPSVADEALCVLVDAAPGNASATAAARCDAHPGCHSFGRCPEYTARHCRSNSSEPVGGGVCFKFFQAGKAGLTPASEWTMWVRTTKL